MIIMPETSKHTSIKKRIHAIKNQQAQPSVIIPFVENHRENMPRGIAYSLKDNFELVDTTGRCIRDGKAGHIDNTHSPILQS